MVSIASSEQMPDDYPSKLETDKHIVITITILAILAILVLVVETRIVATRVKSSVNVSSLPRGIRSLKVAAAS